MTSFRQDRPTTAALLGIRRRQRNRRGVRLMGMVSAVVALAMVGLLGGDTWYGPHEALRVLISDEMSPARFVIAELRLPRVAAGLLAGAAFGISGIVFQTMLRNQLASPDIIGITSGASAAGVIGIVVFSWTQSVVSLFALVAALGTALAIYLGSNRGGFVGTRLILIGIGIAAMLNSIVTYVLSQAAAWDLQTATRWLTGSLNGMTWARIAPLALICALIVPVVIALGPVQGMLRLGDDSAIGLGVRIRRTRVTLICCAVALSAIATAACGPIAFVAFMSGPIALRILGPHSHLAVGSALIGSALVLGADFLGQTAFGARYPVGVVTGVLGAPYLIVLLVAANRQGRA